ncbi:uncharacterized protein MONBRDRAFT_38087 [Monosiga brevicollis MX1]|uniref:GPS domain-containing protein n=2 Tax=Monosiga brevicollis TaxID=81824 RepID=A9V5K9_MONBE|nr:uncharacterized protein MONBRDRAFT_38087 [Monosiga brevicollis MX1]EDQ87058.1 predicted protein [Monosiga brevicollis MX1]|eukprot:XP_001748001.1 hypothetical protein [Monosiga brevicollis MX1]
MQAMQLKGDFFDLFADELDGTVSVMLFGTSSFFHANATVFGDNVISVSVGGNAINLSDYGTDVFEYMQDISTLDADQSLICTYWNFTMGSWAQDGCRAETVNATHTRCICRHLTNFASIVTLESGGGAGNGDGGENGTNPNGGTLSSTDAYTLGVISYIGVSLSTAACIVMLVALATGWTRLRVYQKLIAPLSVFLVVTQLLFITAAGSDTLVEATGVSDSCRVVAALLHYMVLATFALFCCEASELYFNFVRVFGAGETQRFRVQTYVAVVLLLPLIIVLIGVLGYEDDYGTTEYCWLRNESTAAYLLWVPMGVMLLINLTIMVRVLRNISQHAATSEVNVKLLALGFLSFSALLGVGWVCGLLAAALDSVALQYLFAIFSTFQGVAIFVFYFLRDRGFRRYVSIVWCDARLRRKLPNHHVGFSDVLTISSAATDSSQVRSSTAENGMPSRAKHGPPLGSPVLIRQQSVLNSLSTLSPSSHETEF